MLTARVVGSYGVLGVTVEDLISIYTDTDIVCIHTDMIGYK